MAFQGVHHMGLAVTDRERSGEWYARVLEAQHLMDGQLGDAPAKFYMLPGNIVVGLRQDDSTDAGDRFNYARVGLDHIGFIVSDRAEIEKWLARFDEHGVEHSGIVDDSAGAHLNFKDPDGIALEIYLPAPQQG